MLFYVIFRNFISVTWNEKNIIKIFLNKTCHKNIIGNFFFAIVKILAMFFRFEFWILLFYVFSGNQYNILNVYKFCGEFLKTHQIYFCTINIQIKRHFATVTSEIIKITLIYTKIPDSVNFYKFNFTLREIWLNFWI